VRKTDAGPESQSIPSRRAFIARAAGVATLIPIAGIGSAAHAQAPQPGTQAPAPAPAAAAPAPQGYTILGPEEATFVEFVMDVMCPADSLTPSGTDCGLSIFIDRQLAGDFGKGGRMYSHGPWKPGKPQQGYQLPLKPAEFFKSGVAVARKAAQTRFGKPFEQLSPADADAFLTEIQAGKVPDPDGRLSLGDWFSQVLYPLFQQACFSDPVYGGNRNKVFWKMVGFPGLPAFYAQDMVNFRGKPYPPAQTPRSILDFS
jgi:gluconate 2-dehydrogenase gamma chain